MQSVVESDQAIVLRYVRRMPGWEAAGVEAVRSIETGMTNRSIGFTLAGRKYLLRLSGPNTQRLHINRRAEHAAFVSAAAAGVAPRVIQFFPDEGHLIREYVEGTEFSWDDLNRLVVVEQCLFALRRANRAKPIPYTLNPFDDIIQRLQTSRDREILRPEQLSAVLEQMERVREQWWRGSPDVGLCHGDAFINNYLQTADGIILLDWEFAGMADVYWDLVALGCTAEGETRRWLLQMYFEREVTDAMIAKFEAIRWVSRLWNWSWAHLQMHEPDSKPEHRQLESALWSAVVGQRSEA